MSSLTSILVIVLNFVRWAGLIVIAIVAIGILIAESARTKLAATRVIGVGASAVLAGVVLWVLPALINYARIDSNSIVPNFPVGYGS
ncbi:hypothetical protein AB0H71_27130 [Nocardia sp. NPDC050697]|uniref:hypothetical protein n=1 Tax=Nocardia sp. NPDC050697 TaxID=3155158 RepID=UPI00340BD088